MYTHVSTPDVSVEDLILFVEVENLDQRQSERDGDSDGRVADRTSDDPDLLIVTQQVLDESLLVR